MTVVSVRERDDGREARNTRGTRTYSRVFLVKTDDKTDSPYTAGSAAGLPVIGNTYPDDAAAWCVELDVKQVPQAPTNWIVTARYDSTHEIYTNPLNDPAIIAWKSEQFQRVAIGDRNGNAVVNSAGGWYDPPAMFDDSRWIATVRKNLSSAPSWILTYQDAVNSLGFTIDGLSVSAGQAKLTSMQFGEPQVRNGVAFRVMSFDIHFRPEGWDLSLLDYGYARKGDAGAGEDANKRYRVANDGDQTDSESPILLDGSGLPLANPSPATAVFNLFEVYRELDFSVLPLT